MSDRSGAQNIWSATAAANAGGRRGQGVTSFNDGRVLWPTISTDGKTIAFERNFGIWTLDTTSGQAREVSIALRGAPAAAAVEHRTFTDQLQELALSPDGKKVAFTVHGEIFSASAKDGGDAARVTNTAGEEAELAWSPDSRRIVYRSDRDRTHHLFLYDFTTGQETQLTSGAQRDNMPRFSPDGKWIAFERDSRELRDHRSGHARKSSRSPPGCSTRRRSSTRATTPGRPTPDSSPTSRRGAKVFTNVFVAPVASDTSVKAGAGQQISFLANTNAGGTGVEPRRRRT